MNNVHCAIDRSCHGSIQHTTQAHSTGRQQETTSILTNPRPLVPDNLTSVGLFFDTVLSYVHQNYTHN